MFPNVEHDRLLYLIKMIGDPEDIADQLIKQASDIECLTSSSEYIRERKRMYIIQRENNK